MLSTPDAGERADDLYKRYVKEGPLVDWAGRRRQRHLDIDGAIALDDELVDQAEIDEVYRQLGIAHRLQRFEDPRLERAVLVAFGWALDVAFGRPPRHEVEEVLAVVE